MSEWVAMLEGLHRSPQDKGNEMSNFDLGLGDGFLGQILDADMLMEAGVATGGALLGSLAFTALADMVTVKPGEEEPGAGTERKRPLLNTPLKRALGAAGFAVAGGLAAWQVSPDLAKGHVGAMMGAAGGELYNLIAQKETVRLPAKNEVQVASIRQLQLRSSNDDGDGETNGLGDASILMRQQGGGFAGALADASVESVNNFDVPEDDFDLGALSSVVSSI